MEAVRAQELLAEPELLIRSRQIRRRQSGRRPVDKAFKLFFFFGL
jgi:hypothetical protein